MDSLFGPVSQDGSLRSLGSQSGAYTVLLVCPTMWDECEIPHVAAGMRCRVLSYGTDVSEHPEDFDALGFIERAVSAVAGHDIDAVVASDDYPGSILAAVIARRLNLPGPDPGAVFRCQHKYYPKLSPGELGDAPARRLRPPEPIHIACGVLVPGVDPGDALANTSGGHNGAAT